jgi:hypothetical protein
VDRAKRSNHQATVELAASFIFSCQGFVIRRYRYGTFMREVIMQCPSRRRPYPPFPSPRAVAGKFREAASVGGLLHFIMSFASL